MNSAAVGQGCELGLRVSSSPVAPAANHVDQWWPALNRLPLSASPTTASMAGGAWVWRVLVVDGLGRGGFNRRRAARPDGCPHTCLRTCLYMCPHTCPSACPCTCPYACRLTCPCTSLCAWLYTRLQRWARSMCGGHLTFAGHHCLALASAAVGRSGAAIGIG